MGFQRHLHHKYEEKSSDTTKKVDANNTLPVVFLYYFAISPLQLQSLDALHQFEHFVPRRFFGCLPTGFSCSRAEAQDRPFVVEIPFVSLLSLVPPPRPNLHVCLQLHQALRWNLQIGLRSKKNRDINSDMRGPTWIEITPQSSPFAHSVQVLRSFWINYSAALQ